MRGLLPDIGWVQIEEEPEHQLWLKRPGYSIIGDEEAGIFDADEFEEIEP